MLLFRLYKSSFSNNSINDGDRRRIGSNVCERENTSVNTRLIHVHILSMKLKRRSRKIIISNAKFLLLPNCVIFFWRKCLCTLLRQRESVEIAPNEKKYILTTPIFFLLFSLFTRGIFFFVFIF
jgi:hypothetical protein